MMKRLLICIAVAMYGVSMWSQTIITGNDGFDKMTLQDFYKVNYQSYFGAEHMAPDTASVIRYMQYELANMGDCCNIPVLQDIQGYYRVSLQLVKDGRLTAEQLAYAFIESARPVHHEDGEWLARWQRIEKTVLAQYPDLADAELQEALMEAARLNAAVHHSKQYNEAYCPHYRIIRREVFENLARAEQLHLYPAKQQARYDALLRQMETVKEHIGPQSFDGKNVVVKYTIQSFGAKADGKTDCKKAFDKAMKKFAKEPGKYHELIVPAGIWLVKGPLKLVSNMRLRLEEGAVLMFDDDPKYYLPAVPTSWEGSFCQNYCPFIYGYEIANVEICGRGTIDGNAAKTFSTWRNGQKTAQQRLRKQDHQEVPVSERNYAEGDSLRPQLIQFFGCKNVALRDFFVTNSPFWCIHLLHCDGVLCDGLRYDAKLVNNDGIDLEMTRNVLIENVVFNNGDDNIAIKAGRDNDGWGTNNNIAPRGKEALYEPWPCENIVVRNCVFKGLHGVVIGSEMSAGVQNVFVEDCTYGGYCKRALYVKTNPNRGGFVRDIYFRDCAFGEVEDLFYITSMYAGEGADDTHYTEIRDIHVQDVTCDKASNAAIVLQGTEAKPLTNISFERVTVKEAKIGFSSSNTDDVILRNCHLGGEVTTAPTQVTTKDNLWR